MDMSIIYCDGSYHSKFKVGGIGIVCGENKVYYEYNKNDGQFELEAILKSVEYGISKKLSNFIIFNDNKPLVDSINKAKKGEGVSVKMINNPKFSKLISLIKSKNIQIKFPDDGRLCDGVHEAHNLSRRYLWNEELFHKRSAMKVSFKFKKPIELKVGQINRKVLTKDQISAMNLVYHSLVKYDTKYTIQQILDWIERIPTSNTKNGRKYAVKKFVERFH